MVTFLWIESYGTGGDTASFFGIALRVKIVPVFFVCTMTAACIFYNMPLYTYYVYKGIYTIGSGKYFLYKYKKSLW